VTYPTDPREQYRQPRFTPSQPPPPRGQQPPPQQGYQPQYGYQPPGPPPRKRHVLRYVLLGLGTFIVVIVAVSAALGSKGASAPSAASAPGAAASTPAAAAAKAAALGTAVRDGKFQFTVTSVTQAKSVGDTADGVGDTAQGEYAILHVTVTNISSAPQTLDDAAQYVYDAGGRKYDASSSADIDLNSASGSDSVFLNDINPGNTVQGQLAFDMPAGVRAVKAELHDSPFSNGVTVSLP
jgi:hypothetical protein